ncbi:CoA-binding protein [Paenibacillus physcomitrellae]|uniref:CoA-binding protein n=1 Tax=Paenibacillus physcomitrellae TaxID=1619311 RepID=A0ABQ1FMH0_9BACL|nr:CoA-binding protein [Paenibacillus physcomitrellae]GGA21561.1 CoA-binding protein [Paenibacillus physcomitrellae]
MAFANPDREQIKAILEQAGTIAVVGLSGKPDRTSNMVARAMQKRGYRIIPVNPSVQGEILGERCYASLKDIEQPIDIVNVFRRSEFTPDIAKEAVEVGATTLWLQQGIVNEQAAEIAAEAGLNVIMDRCIKVEDAVLKPERQNKQ